MVLTLLLIGTLQVTSYRSVKNQTDSTPFTTSTGERVHPYGVAVSEDLLCPHAYGKHKVHKKVDCPYYNRIHYGDWLYVEGYGLKVVNDVMNPRHKQSIDLWVRTLAQEKAVGVKRLEVYVVSSEVK